MRRVFALALSAALAACHGPTTVDPGPSPSPAELACATQVDQDPALKEARAISAGRLDWLWQHEPEVEQIKRDALTRCLRARGLAPRGGVERPRPG